MTDKKHIEDLVNKLDSLFSEGVGHVDLDFKNNSQTVFTTKSYNECNDGKNACGIPTEHFSDDE